MDAFEARAPKPWVMVGHSMGGALNLLTLQAGESRFAGAVLSSPMLRVKTGKRSMWSVKLAVRWNVRHGKAGDFVLDDPDDPFDHTFEKDALTSDQTRYELWRQQLFACPHLAVGGPTWGWLAFALDAGERVLKPKALKSVLIPCTVVQSGEDDRVWKQTNRWAAKLLGRGRYVEVAGAKHEVIMETDEMRAVFLNEFDAMADYVSPVNDLAPLASARTLASPTAMMRPSPDGGRPVQSVTCPPAASTTGTRADQSQILRPVSATMSIRPMATMA
jgi:lysophospholipase